MIGIKGKWYACLGVVLIFGALPLFFSEFWVRLFMEILCFSIFAMGFNLAMGYGGMVSFGHAAFFGAAGYLVAILLTKTSVPAMITLILAPIFGAFLGLIIGLFCVRLRAFYFSILTLAFNQLIWSVLFKWYDMTGGENGIIGVPIPGFISASNNMYYFTYMITIISFYLMYRIIQSPFGLTLLSLRENSQRGAFVGISPNRYRLYALIISTSFSGLAGGLYALISRGVFPDIASAGKSGEVLLCCVLGGMHTFWGPAVGAGLMIFLETIISSYTERWLLVLGILFLLAVFFLPQGVMGYKWKDKTFASWEKGK